MSTRDILKAVIAVLMFGASIAFAVFDPVNDDTDIFLANPAIPAERPNVLIVLDNTANWNQAFANEKSALVQVINGLTDAFNVGLMMFPETGSPNDSVDGAYVRYHVRRMTSENKVALSSLVNGLDINSDKGNNATTGLALHEAFLYYSGRNSIASHGKIKTDKDGTTDPLLSPLTEHALPAGTSSAPYRSPIKDGCARNFVIYISNGPAAENASARSDLEAKLATLTGVTPPSIISITPGGLQGNWADEMAKFMANADVMSTNAGVPNSEQSQNVYTYVVEVDPGGTGQGPDMTALMKSTAANGKGKYFGVSSSASGTAIVDALNAIFTEVQAVNSVFASTTLPVSVNVRGTNLNQVYIGVFRPDPTKSPRWMGNLKMYNLALNSATGSVFLADAANGPPPATGNAAENTTTGFVSQNSPSFWTSNSAFWGFRDPSQNGPGGPSDFPDGDLVEKGGAAQQLRIAYASAEASATPRNLYTCTTGDVSGTSQTCAPNAGFQLTRTPFTTGNAAIDGAALQLDTRLVSPLSAYASKPITSLVDRRGVTLVNSFGGVNVTSLNNGATTRTITNLTTAAPKNVTTLSGLVSGTITVNLATGAGVTGIAKDGANYLVKLASPLSGVTAGSTVLTINCTAGSGFADFNSLASTARTVASVVSTTEYRIPGPSGNKTCTAGTVSGPGQVASSTITVNLPGHGFTSAQNVTIQGATPAVLNQSNVGITVPTVSGSPDPNNFTYTLPGGQTAGVGSPAVSGVPVTAAGNTTTATATTTGAHGFAHGSTVLITGASDAAYNGSKVISCTSNDCTGKNTFTYSVGAIAKGPNTSSPVYAVQGGSTTVTVTTASAHGFVDGQTVVISGSDIGGYNGSFAISCPSCTGAETSFSFTAPSVLPANNSGTVTASSGTSSLVLATLPNHGYAAPDSIVIEGGAPHAGTYPIAAILDANRFIYFTSTALAPPSGSYTARLDNIHRAYATVAAHGYGAAGATKSVLITGASPAAYNTTNLVALTTVTIIDADTFYYTLSSLPGLNVGLAATASIKSTLARATSVNHGFANGSTVSIAGASPGAFNGPFTITVLDANTFTYGIGSEQGDATGTIAAGQASGSSAERDAIIRWVRGQDNFQDENSNASLVDIRASVHGDVLHSRPAVINYNRYTGSDDDVFVFYGANDGIFHAIKGGYAVPTGDTSGMTPGKEAWGFVPEEFFSQFKRMRNNSPTISSSFKRPYFMDGPIGVYTKDGDTPPDGKLGGANDTVNLYITNRRGGRFIYALDVNNPLDPKYLWKINNATTGFSELGQTWSQPTVVTGLAGLSTPVLIFSAGYDPNIEDLDPAVISSVNTTSATVDGVDPGGLTTTAGVKVNRSMGRGIFVVNALTGALIWRASYPGSGAHAEVPGMIYAIPSDVTVVRNESGGPTNRAYVGDTGGNVWRIDFKIDSDNASTNLDLTTVTKLASVANQGTSAGRRKFLFPPDVVGMDGFDAVLLGSGDREHPFDETVTNRFYMFKDRGGDTGAVTGASECNPAINEAASTDADCDPATIPGMTDLTSNCIQDTASCLAGETAETVAAKLGTDRGWFVTLATGEKVVGNAISIGGTTFFNTNQPSATAGGGTCGSNLGVARQYQLATADATATTDLNAVGGLTKGDRSLIHAGGGYLPSPVHVVVRLGGKPVEAVISGIQVSTPAGATLSSRLRKYWYKEVDPR